MDNKVHFEDEQKKLAVVVPIYNAENYLKKCIDSILNQSYSNLEIILVDDGSVDDSGIICDEYAELDERIKVIHKANGGDCYAKKDGLNAASAEYVTFVDSDDWIEQRMYSFLMEKMAEHDADVVTSGFIKNNDGEKSYDMVEAKVYSGEELDLLKEKVLFDSDRDMPGPLTMSVCNKIYKTAQLKIAFDMLPTGIHLWEDLLYAYVPILNANTVVVTCEAFYHYMENPNSLTRKEDASRVDKYLYTFRCAEELYKKFGSGILASYYFFCIKVLAGVIENALSGIDKNRRNGVIQTISTDAWVQGLVYKEIRHYRNRDEAKIIIYVLKGKLAAAILVNRIRVIKVGMKQIAYRIVLALIGKEGIARIKKSMRN